MSLMIIFRDSQVCLFGRFYLNTLAEWLRALNLKSGGAWFKASTLLLCVNSQLVGLPPVGILNSLCYIYNI